MRSDFSTKVLAVKNPLPSSENNVVFICGKSTVMLRHIIKYAQLSPQVRKLACLLPKLTTLLRPTDRVRAMVRYTRLTKTQGQRTRITKSFVLWGLVQHFGPVQTRTLNTSQVISCHSQPAEQHLLRKLCPFIHPISITLCRVVVEGIEWGLELIPAEIVFRLTEEVWAPGGNCTDMWRTCKGAVTFFFNPSTYPGLNTYKTLQNPGDPSSCYKKSQITQEKRGFYSTTAKCQWC